MAPCLFAYFCLISSVLLTGVTSLQCYKCFTTNGPCRNEDMTLVECEPDKTHCISLSLRTTFTTPSVIYTAKTCATPEEANEGYFTMTSSQKNYFELHLHSCQSDGCNGLPCLLPRREELKPNGKMCTGSYTRPGDSPQPAQTVLCLGNENQCVDMEFSMETLGFISEEASIQACATNDVCSYPLGETQMGEGIVTFNLSRKNCTFASQSLDMMFFNM